MAESLITQMDSGGVCSDRGIGVAGKIERLGRSVIVYDGSLVSQIREEFFEPDCWPDARPVPGYSGGRGTTLFVCHEDQEWALRHFHRGGIVSRLLRDQFPWVGEDRTRSFLEWRLLHRLQQLRLPAPAPVAARYVRTGPYYTADLITLRLPGVVPLSRRLEQGPASQEIWYAVGACVGRFHAEHVFHADLTAHNLQIDDAGGIWLLDFDRGRIMRGRGNWCARNLSRLRRSFRKISAGGEVGFSESEWSVLLRGYRETLGSPND